MARFKVTVPPTIELGSYVTEVSDGFHQTAAQAALQDYNNARAHDGLPTIRRMPNGTRYQLIKNTKPTEKWITEMVKSGDLPKQKKGWARHPKH